MSAPSTEPAPKPSRPRATRLRRVGGRVRRRSRRAARSVVVGSQLRLAGWLDRRGRQERALRVLTDAARRSPADQQVSRRRAQLLARTGRLSEAVAELSRHPAAGRAPATARMQRGAAGRLVDSDPAWRPVVPGPYPVGPETSPLPGRVLYLAKESMPQRNNGYCTRTHETLLALRRAGRDPVAVTLPGFGDASSSTLDGVVYRHVMPGAQELLAGLTLEEYVQVTTTRFARELVRTRPQVLHAGSGHRGYDLALPGLALARWAGLPWIYEVRSFFETTWTADDRHAESAEYYHRRFAAETRAMRAADAVVTLSGPMRAEIVERHGVPEDRVFVVPNAVDPQRFDPQRRDPVLRARLGLEGRFVLGYVSNLDHRREGQEVLLEAAARLRRQGHPVAVLLVGEGRRRSELERRAVSLGLGADCVFAGSVPFDEVAAYYAQIDLFVVPRVAERAARLVSPIKPFEAMAMRVPLLMADLPALVEIAGADQRRGLVFTAGDPAALATAVAAVIDRPQVRAAMAAEAERWVRSERTWDANGRAFDEVYRFAADRFATDRSATDRSAADRLAPEPC